MKCAIHQATYLPSLHLFHKMAQVDKFVILDDCNISKSNHYYNKNRIKTPQGEQWLTVPIKSHTCNLQECEIANNKWKTHLKTIFYNYKKTPYFIDYFKYFEKIYKKDFKYLKDLNIELILLLKNLFQIKTPIFFSSNLNIISLKNKRNIDIVKKLDCDHYLSGIGAKDYNNKEMFHKNNIILEYQEFKYPIYNQIYGKFIPNLSAIDYLFNKKGWIC